MTPEQLAAIGEALYGYGWQSEMARRRGVSHRTVRHWASGRNRMPGDLAAWLLSETDARAVDIANARQLLQGWLAAAAAE